MPRARGTAPDPEVTAPAGGHGGEPGSRGGPRRVLVAGAGYVGAPLARLLVQDGLRVHGLRRTRSGLPEGVLPLYADVDDRAALAEVIPADLDAIVYAVSPAERTGDAYRRAYVDGLANVVDAAGRGASRFPGRVILVGSTGVYGTSDGSRVDEDTPPAPIDPTGRVLLEAEAAARALGSPGIVLRLGGIYGPERDRTVRRVVSGEAECPEPGTFGNRIHRDDAAAAARHLLYLPDPEPIYLGVDRAPADLRDVYRWIAGQTGAPDPCRSGSANTASPTRRRTANKRCIGDRLVASGFRFTYPTYREGYAPLIDALVHR